MLNFFIINKSGGLIYTLHKDLEVNKQLVLLSTLHTLYAYVTEIEFLFNKEEIEPLTIVLNKQTISLFRTITGYTLVFIDNTPQDLARFKEAYTVFVHYALMDPFYVDEMPINSKKFRLNISKIFERRKFF